MVTQWLENGAHACQVCVLLHFSKYLLTACYISVHVLIAGDGHNIVLDLNELIVEETAL